MATVKLTFNDEEEDVIRNEFIPEEDTISIVKLTKAVYTSLTINSTLLKQNVILTGDLSFLLPGFNCISSTILPDRCNLATLDADFKDMTT